MDFFMKQRKFKSDHEEIEYVVNIILNLPEERERGKTVPEPFHPEDKASRQRDLSCKYPFEQSVFMVDWSNQEGGSEKKEVCGDEEKKEDFSLMEREKNREVGVEEWSVYKEKPTTQQLEGSEEKVMIEEKGENKEDELLLSGYESVMNPENTDNKDGIHGKNEGSISVSQQDNGGLSQERKEGGYSEENKVKSEDKEVGKAEEEKGAEILDYEGENDTNSNEDAGARFEKRKKRALGDKSGIEGEGSLDGREGRKVQGFVGFESKAQENDHEIIDKDEASSMEKDKRTGFLGEEGQSRDDRVPDERPNESKRGKRDSKYRKMIKNPENVWPFLEDDSEDEESAVSETIKAFLLETQKQGFIARFLGRVAPFIYFCLESISMI